MICFMAAEAKHSKRTDIPAAYTATTLTGTAMTPFAQRIAFTMIRAEQELERMTGLNINWQDMDAEPPNTLARRIAKSVLACAYMVGLEPYLVTASSGSGVGICFKKNGLYADVECFNSGEIATTFIDRQKSVNTRELFPSSIVDVLTEISHRLNA